MGGRKLQVLPGGPECLQIGIARSTLTARTPSPKTSPTMQATFGSSGWSTHGRTETASFAGWARMPSDRYCSKHADGPHSIAKDFADDAGNIWFERMEHTWADGNCKFCRVGQNAFRSVLLEAR